MSLNPAVSVCWTEWGLVKGVGVVTDNTEGRVPEQVSPWSLGHPTRLRLFVSFSFVGSVPTLRQWWNGEKSVDPKNRRTVRLRLPLIDHPLFSSVPFFHGLGKGSPE